VADDSGWCASVSAALDEPLYGTASVVRSWLLLEHPGTWPSDAVGGSGLPPEVVRLLEVGSRETGVRVLFLRRPGASAGDENDDGGSRGRHLFLVHSPGPDPWVQHRLLEDPAEVGRVDFRRLAGGEHQPAGWAEPWPDPLYLVCTHARHDQCCGRLGRPLARALAEGADGGDNVWESSHFGGERFAGNIVCFPHGLYFGRVDPAGAGAVVDAYRRGEIDLDHYRGRAGDPFVVQAAEYFLRRDTGLIGIDEVSVAGRPTVDGDVLEVALATEDGRFSVRVARRQAPPARPLTCTADRPVHPPAYALEGIQRL
jgi:Sucrase/ferredoxin-like